MKTIQSAEGILRDRPSICLAAFLFRPSHQISHSEVQMIRSIFRSIIIRKQYFRSLMIWSPLILSAAFLLTVLRISMSAEYREHTAIKFESKSEWVPGRSYPLPVEAGLEILTVYSPDLTKYARDNGVPIEIDDWPTWKHLGLKDGTLGWTLEATGHIRINGTDVRSPSQIAASLGHEICHVQYGDPQSQRPIRSRLSKLLWRTEEADCHMRMVPILEMMRIKYPDVDSLTKPWVDLLFWAAVPYVTGFAILALLLALHSLWYRIWKNNPSSVHRREPNNGIST
jgi:hypothetical protein